MFEKLSPMSNIFAALKHGSFCGALPEDIYEKVAGPSHQTAINKLFQTFNKWLKRKGAPKYYFGLTVNH